MLIGIILLDTVQERIGFALDRSVLADCVCPSGPIYTHTGSKCGSTTYHVITLAGLSFALPHHTVVMFKIGARSFLAWKRFQSAATQSARYREPWESDIPYDNVNPHKMRIESSFHRREEIYAIDYAREPGINSGRDMTLIALSMT